MGRLIFKKDFDKDKLQLVDSVEVYSVAGNLQGALIDEETGEAFSFVSIIELKPKDWYCFLSPAANIKERGLEVARGLKRLLHEVVLPKIDWERVFTVSNNTPRIERWMKFMGFQRKNRITLEKVKGEFFIWEVVANGC